MQSRIGLESRLLRLRLHPRVRPDVSSDWKTRATMDGGIRLCRGMVVPVATQLRTIATSDVSGAV